MQRMHVLTPLVYYLVSCKIAKHVWTACRHTQPRHSLPVLWLCKLTSVIFSSVRWKSLLLFFPLLPKFVSLSCFLPRNQIPANSDTSTITRIHHEIHTMTECTDDKDPTRTDSQDDSIPEGSVPLHRLCDRCRQMFDTWDKTCQWFGATEGLEPSRGYERYELCTLTDMMKSRQSCHLCEMLYSQIKQNDGISFHEPIVCQIGLPSFWEPYTIRSTLGMSLLLNGRVLSPDCVVIHKTSGGKYTSITTFSKCICNPW